VETLKEFVDFFLHLDVYLNDWVIAYGPYIYAILFLIIFVETGLVVMPLLPGDSLLFAVGTLAAQGSLNIIYLIVLLFIAAVMGDTVNYLMGKNIGLKVLKWRIGKRQLVKQAHIDKTHEFYEKYGPKTIILARFVPIVRTFAPFVAGIGEMNYKKFISFNIIGGAIWIVGLLLLGYTCGNIPWVKENFETVIFGIIFISILPIIIELVKAWRNKRKEAKIKA
jgi:membrane-associated protein